ncbi:hypothetical protein LNP25_19930 [Klebsiella variicola subsp. variicola]|nr:hypothetical protein [Klebsiella variicola subsp. variicola]
MAQGDPHFRENGLARQQLEQQRDADWAIRELLARVTQRLQGCETIEDVIKVAELFAPNIAPTIPVNCIFWIPIHGRCAAWRSGCRPPGRRRPLLSRRLLGDTAGTQPSAGAG